MKFSSIKTDINQFFNIKKTKKPKYKNGFYYLLDDDDDELKQKKLEAINNKMILFSLLESKSHLQSGFI